MALFFWSLGCLIFGFAWGITVGCRISDGIGEADD